MKTICCVCDTVIRDDHKNDGKISHGYCTRCKDFTLETYRRDKTHYVKISCQEGLSYQARMDDIDPKLFGDLKGKGYTQVEVW